jgi:NADH:ubiquinone oxidoreductase subunit F (NADH-binding)
MIVQELHEIQHRCGYLPREELERLAQRLNVPPYRLHEVASCFPHYRLQPPPVVDVRVCRDMACFLRGATGVERSLQAYGQELSQTMGVAVSVGGVSCLGQCDRPPAVAINDHIFRGLGEDELRAGMRSAAAREPLMPQQADRRPLGWKIDCYNGQPGFEAVRKFVETRDVDGVLNTLQSAGLVGMGGASFPTHLKWRLVKAEPDPEKYVVCNADESEPATFKDRELLRRAPHLVIEGMVLAGLVTGATKGWIYVRHEFEEEIEVVREAILAARERGVCGERLLGSELTFILDVFVSPGGYICGEESALLEAMEDKRAEPRNKPPFPVKVGLWNKPTVINNVETLSWVPSILLRNGWLQGADAYRTAGVNGATGMRFVSICGDVNRPGVYEVPFGQTVRDLIHGCAGGMRDGQKLKAIAPSGPSGGFLPAVLRKENMPPAFVQSKMAGNDTFEILDLTLDPATLRAAGSMLGAAFVAIGERTDMVEFAQNCTQFFRNESCGKCVPCRMGSQKLVDLLNELLAGRLPRAQLGLVNELGEVMETTSICGLGMVAPNPFRSLIRHFREDVERYLARKG